MSLLYGVLQSLDDYGKGGHYSFCKTLCGAKCKIHLVGLWVFRKDRVYQHTALIQTLELECEIRYGV